MRTQYKVSLRQQQEQSHFHVRNCTYGEVNTNISPDNYGYL